MGLRFLFTCVGYWVECFWLRIIYHMFTHIYCHVCLQGQPQIRTTQNYATWRCNFVHSSRGDPIGDKKNVHMYTNTENDMCCGVRAQKPNSNLWVVAACGLQQNKGPTLMFLFVFVSLSLSLSLYIYIYVYMYIYIRVYVYIYIYIYVSICRRLRPAIARTFGRTCFSSKY